MVDFPAGPSTTASVLVGRQFTDRLEGHGYVIGLSGAGSSALSNQLAPIHASAGHLLATDDDGGIGLNSPATFQAGHAGVLHVEPGGYQEPRAGDHQLSVDIATPPKFIDSIDWGTQVATNSIDIYFAASGETFDGETSEGWNAYEQQQMLLALQQISNVANVTFNVVNNSVAADFKLVTVSSVPYLGYFNPPGTANQGVGVFATDGRGWHENNPGSGGLEQGGYGFITLIHELGHGMGLAHPHDTGGSSEVWSGVTGAFGSYGDFDLNQGVYTTMSYNDGWENGPAGAPPSDSYGWQGTMMAFDIALLQQKYGANTSYRSGDSVYTLSNANAVGTYYSSIWDVGGTDVIRYLGAADATIDLRPAHLGYSTGSGGYISHVAGIHGGYTIANGVLIENARGGSGSDLIRGNSAGNKLQGMGGADNVLGGGGGDRIFGGGGSDVINGNGQNDRLWGQNGADLMRGGAGNDIMLGGLGRDIYFGGAGNDIMRFKTIAQAGIGNRADRIADFAPGDRVDLSRIDADGSAGGNQAFTFIGMSAFSGSAGELRYRLDSGKVVVGGDVDGDMVADFEIRLNGLSGIAAGDFLL